ncbi:phosphonate ABC transporter, permease protein PhnE [Nitrospinae bacterium AH_259_B05_G02_I21]|nr:phosphonate ABC transporter, permease protein PhnE [Nitrospinae bacterium AH_259_B05_G02_I21]MDA2931677.1 phosphonate ABC transporter, permease protein PhnE [Nitrospinae bacterium AH-259-F20]
MATTLSVSIVPPTPPGRLKQRLRSVGLTCIILALLVWAWSGTEMNVTNLVRSGPRIVEFLDRMYPPDLAWSDDETRPFAPPLRLAAGVVAVTLQISLLGTALGVAVALLLGFLGAENLTPHWVHHPIKIVLALLRSIPVILLALLFVAAVGLGAFPGVLAIAIHSIGMLGKLFAEECESVSGGLWEAMDSSGANWLQKVRYAIWPQVAPQINSLTLFRLEMNIRDSAVLGLVGVAGLGLWIENYRRAFDYASVSTMVIVTMLVVLAVDQASFLIQRHLK